jgi:hypothetical protein
MADATQVISQVRDAIAVVDDQIRQHPYLDALEDGSVPEPALRAFPGHQYHIAGSDFRSMAILLQRFGDTSARDFFFGMLQGEQAAIAALARMGRKLGMSEQDLAAYEISATGFAYATYMAWLALYASAAEFTCGILVNFAAWGANCGRMSEALRTSYGFTEDETAFLDGFANLPPFEDTASSIIQDGLDHGVDPSRLLQASRLFQAYEKMFWDAMHSAAIG